MAALLSAVNAHDGTLPASVADQPVLAHQIAVLRNIGIRKFLIEVDSISGSLVAMADRLQQSGNSVEFIRSTFDLRSKLGGAETIIVQAEGVYIAPELLTDLLRQPGLFIATVDGRAENEAFERMDLNTRWAGVAVFPAKMAATIGELPGGWSMGSSLLRQAIQDNIPQRPLKQSHLQQGSIRHIQSMSSAEQLARDIMAKRAGREPGWIEAKLFARVAARISALLWRVASRVSLTDGVALMLGVGSVILATVGWPISATFAAIAAIFANNIRLAMGNGENAVGLSRWIEPAIWLLLLVALITAAASDAYQLKEGVFAGAMVGGLTILARQLRLPDWGRKMLQSPALIALMLIMITPVIGIADAAKALASAQLLLLVLAKWNHQPPV
jgi:hypothetical protein